MEAVKANVPEAQQIEPISDKKAALLARKEEITYREDQLLADFAEVWKCKKTMVLSASNKTYCHKRGEQKIDSDPNDAKQWLDECKLVENTTRRLQSVRFLAWQQTHLSEDVATSEASVATAECAVQQERQQLLKEEATVDEQNGGLQRTVEQLMEAQEQCVQEMSERWRSLDEREEEMQARCAEEAEVMALREQQGSELEEACEAIQAAKKQLASLQREEALLSDQKQDVEAREAALQCVIAAWECAVQQTCCALFQMPGGATGDSVLQQIRKEVTDRIVEEVLWSDPILARNPSLVRSIVMNSLSSGTTSPTDHVVENAIFSDEADHACHATDDSDGIYDTRSVGESTPKEQNTDTGEESRMQSEPDWRSPPPCLSSRNVTTMDRSTFAAPLSAGSQLLEILPKASVSYQPLATYGSDAGSTLLPQPIRSSPRQTPGVLCLTQEVSATMGMPAMTTRSIPHTPAPEHDSQISGLGSLSPMSEPPSARLDAGQHCPLEQRTLQSVNRTLAHPVRVSTLQRAANMIPRHGGSMTPYGCLRPVTRSGSAVVHRSASLSDASGVPIAADLPPWASQGVLQHATVATALTASSSDSCSMARSVPRMVSHVSGLSLAGSQQVVSPTRAPVVYIKQGMVEVPALQRRSAMPS